MKTRAKKLVNGRVLRLESEGQLKEVIIKEDFLSPDHNSVSLCFKGNEESGIVELNAKELEFLFKEIEPKAKLFKNIKVLKFKK